MARKKVKVRIKRDTFIAGEFTPAMGKDKKANVVSLDENVAADVVSAGKAEYVDPKEAGNTLKGGQPINQDG